MKLILNYSIKYLLSVVIIFGWFFGVGYIAHAVNYLFLAFLLPLPYFVYKSVTSLKCPRCGRKLPCQVDSFEVEFSA
jgi:hypothetical protein